MKTITRSGVRLAHRLSSVLLAATLVGSTPGGPMASPLAADGGPQESRKGTVWVVNRDKGTLAVFDATDGTVLETLVVGAGAHDICISERAGKAYVTAETIHMVTAVDLETLATESIPVSPLPHHCEPSHDGRILYVTLASHSTTVGAPQYAVIDTTDHSVSYVTTSSNPAARAHAPYPSLDGGTVYVAHDVGDAVSRVDTATGTASFIATIARAEETIATRFGNQLWVSSRGDGTVKRVDLDTNAITGVVPVGVQPESVMLTPSERTLAVSLRGSPATIAFVDTANLTLLGAVPIAGAGTAGDLAVMSDDGRYVYATFDAGVSGTGGVAVLDVRTREVVDIWMYPDSGRPHGIWYSRKTR